MHTVSWLLSVSRYTPSYFSMIRPSQYEPKSILSFSYPPSPHPPRPSPSQQISQALFFFSLFGIPEITSRLWPPRYKGSLLPLPMERERHQASVSGSGPLQLAIQVVPNRHAGEKKSYWDKINKGNYYLELCMPLFVLSQCDFCSPAGRFCTTWMASCKGPIDLTSSGFTFKLLLNPFTYKRHNASVYKPTQKNAPTKVYRPNPYNRKICPRFNLSTIPGG